MSLEKSQPCSVIEKVILSVRTGAFRFLHRYRELSGHQPENCVDPIYEYTLFWI